MNDIVEIPETSEREASKKKASSKKENPDRAVMADLDIGDAPASTGRARRVVELPGGITAHHY